MVRDRAIVGIEDILTKKQKVSFWLAEGHLLLCKSYPFKRKRTAFATQKDSFYNALIINMLQRHLKLYAIWIVFTFVKYSFTRTEVLFTRTGSATLAP